MVSSVERTFLRPRKGEKKFEIGVEGYNIRCLRHSMNSRAAAVKNPSRKVLLQLPSQPRPRHFPIALDGSMSHAENLRSLFNRETAKEFQLDNTGLLGIESGKLFERFVQRQHIEVRLRG